jgi:hypothetical protein
MLHASGPQSRPARRRPCNRVGDRGWTQSFARTRGRSRRTQAVLPVARRESRLNARVFSRLVVSQSIVVRRQSVGSRSSLVSRQSFVVSQSDRGVTGDFATID